MKVERFTPDELKPRAYGTFRKVNEYLFRTEAYLQWGESTEPLGLVVMLNPGSSHLLDAYQMQLLESGIMSEASGELELDNTMQVVANILAATHPCLNGRLHIRNLFNLRWTPGTAAIKQYQRIHNHLSYTEVMHDSFTNVGDFPWVWMGFTLESNSVLNKRKQQVFDEITSHPIDKFLIPKGKRLIHSRHPSPQLKNHAEEYHSQMVEIMKAYWEQFDVNESDLYVASGYELHKDYTPFIRVADISQYGDTLTITMGSPDPQDLFMRRTRVTAYDTALTHGFLVPAGRDDGAQTFGQGNECLRSFYYHRRS